MKHKLSLNQQAVAGLAKVLVAVIIAVVIGYAEVMYLQIMGRAFPDGILKIVAMIGAVGTGLSVLTLLIAKAYWFRPGGQMLAAWVFTGVEVVILLLNVLLSFALAGGGKLDGYLGVWYTLTPSSPLFALVGWILILHLDRGQQERHADLELEEEMQRAERQHKIATHQAKMELREAYLKSHTTYLQQEVNSPEIQRQLAMGASALAARELSELTGMHIAPRLSGPAFSAEGSQFPNAKTVESGTPSALPTGSRQDWTSWPKDREPNGSLSFNGDAWLARVNERVQQERAARLAQERGALSGQQAERLSRLASAAEAKGYSLERLEQLVGVQAAEGDSRLVRLSRLASAAEAKGYSLQRLEQMFGLPPASDGAPVSKPGVPAAVTSRGLRRARRRQAAEAAKRQAAHVSKDEPSQVEYRARRPGQS